MDRSPLGHGSAVCFRGNGYPCLIRSRRLRSRVPWMALALRQRTIANNIANVNTPDYQAKRVSFEDALAASVKAGDGHVAGHDSSLARAHQRQRQQRQPRHRDPVQHRHRAALPVRRPIGRERIQLDPRSDGDQLMTFDAHRDRRHRLTLHRNWLDAISDNIANINTVKPTSGPAFQARYVVAQEGAGNSGVYVAGAAFGSADGSLAYDPTNPLADADGMVQASRHRPRRPRCAAHHGAARLPGQRRRRRPGEDHVPGRTPDWTIMSIPLIGAVQSITAASTTPADAERAVHGRLRVSRARSAARSTTCSSCSPPPTTLAIQAVTGNLDDIHDATIAATRAQVTLNSSPPCATRALTRSTRS